jgi:lysophospholipase L1-like esterase
MWVARSLGVPYSGYAEDGAEAPDVLARQIPAFRARAADPDARYDVGCLYVGTNDVRTVEWDATRFERDFRPALGFLAERCARTLTLTVPLDLGRPRAGAKVEELNRVIERVAGELGALVVDLRGLTGRRVLMADHVHPTAFGQIAIAERALAVLAADGLPARVMPSELVSYETTWRGRLRGDLSYTYRHAKVSAEAAAKLLRHRLQQR